MSMLGGVPGLRGLTFNVGVAATGVMIVVFAIGLRQRLSQIAPTKIGFGLLVVGGLGLIGAGSFHCSVGCRNILTEPDLAGRLHFAASFLGGLGTGLALFFIWLAMRRSETWRACATPTLLAAILANISGIVFWTTMFTGSRLHSFEGLIQRMGLVVVLIWIFFVAAKLRHLRLTGDQDHDYTDGLSQNR